MNLYDKYQFVLEWDELPEDFREKKIAEYVSRGEKRPCEACGEKGEILANSGTDDTAMQCSQCKGTGGVDPDPDDLHQQDEAEEDIKSHFPIYF